MRTADTVVHMVSMPLVLLLVIVGGVLLINRHFVVRLAAGLFLVIGVLVANNSVGRFISETLNGIAHLVT